jgi:translation initiation factor IF-3
VICSAADAPPGAPKKVPCAADLTFRVRLEGPATVHWIAGAVQFFLYGGIGPIAFRELRINEQIRIPTLRLFDDTTGESLGIVPIERARQLAAERELDLVEVAPQAQPPVARLMDYGRYKFEALKKEKESRREHNVINVKEMKLRPKISEHDFQTKFSSVRHFLEDGDKVKLTIMFRGREMVHQEYGRRLLDRIADELQETATIERMPLVEGRNMTMILSPMAKKHSKAENRENNRRPQPAQQEAAPATSGRSEEEQSHAEDQNA